MFPRHGFQGSYADPRSRLAVSRGFHKTGTVSSCATCHDHFNRCSNFVHPQGRPQRSSSCYAHVAGNPADSRSSISGCQRTLLTRELPVSAAAGLATLGPVICFRVWRERSLVVTLPRSSLSSNLLSRFPLNPRHRPDLRISQDQPPPPPPPPPPPGRGSRGARGGRSPSGFTSLTSTFPWFRPFRADSSRALYAFCERSVSGIRVTSLPARSRNTARNRVRPAPARSAAVVGIGATSIIIASTFSTRDFGAASVRIASVIVGSVPPPEGAGGTSPGIGPWPGANPRGPRAGPGSR